MSLPYVFAILVAIAAMFGVLRSLHTDSQTRALRIGLQLLSAILLYLIVYPPQVPTPRSAGVVLTPGVDFASIRDLRSPQELIALSGVAIDGPRVETFPDLATALRRNPQIDRLRVFGYGLSARDRDAVTGLAVDFKPSTLPPGIVELDWPRSIVAGSLWQIRGRMSNASSAVRVELRDPSGSVVTTADIDVDGIFKLDAGVAPSVTSLYRLQVFAENDARVEDVPLPVEIRQAGSAQMLVLGGAPDAELKYLRRWATDAGIDLASRISLSRGIQFRENELALDLATLGKADLLVADERSWASLNAASRSAIAEAVGQGLGLMLRINGELPKSVAEEWAGLGFRLEKSELSRDTRLKQSPGITITRQPLRIVAPGSARLLDADDDSDLARWRAFGQGRIAVSIASDLYRIALVGEGARYADLWSRVFTTIARSRGRESARLPEFSWVHERSEMCALSDSARIEDRAGSTLPLLVRGGCAAFWPVHAGWHRLIDGDLERRFYVFAADEAQTLSASRTIDATQLLVRDLSANRASEVTQAASRWPIFMLWLLVATWLWWLERKAWHSSE
jgi:hypothetical protein